MKKVSVIAVLVGGVVDVGTTFILAVPLVVYVIASSGVAHAPGVQPHVPVATIMRASPGLNFLQWLIGLSCSVLGGYVAALLAKHDELLNGLLSSYLCIMVGALSMISGKSSTALSMHLLVLVTSPALGLLGGYLRRLQTARVSTPS